MPIPFYFSVVTINLLSNAAAIRSSLQLYPCLLYTSHSNAEFSDDSSGNLPDFGTYSLSAKNHLFFREKESDNDNNCFCSFFCSYGFFDE